MSDLSENDQLLVDTVARHFPNAIVSGNDVDLGFAGLHIFCRVNDVFDFGQMRSAALFFWLWGGPLGETSSFASMSGYGESDLQAIVSGGCHWSCSFGEMLKVAFGDEKSEEVGLIETEINGQPFKVFIGSFDRVMGRQASEGDALELMANARQRFGLRKWLLNRVIEKSALPILAPGQVSLLSVFVMDTAQRRTVEVKVNGMDVPGSERAFEAAHATQTESWFLLRELAVAIPAGEACALQRDQLGRTLSAMAAPLEGDRRVLADWPGFRAHNGRLGTPASEHELQQLEQKIGRLPEDYRHFLTTVQTAGSGPGYGLISPFHDAQIELATGALRWRDEEAGDDAVGALVLAHAGCSNVWLLMVTGSQRGEVWMDARGSDGAQRCVAASFDDWYRDWLATLVRGRGNFVQWDGACCAPPKVVSQFLTSLEEREGLQGDAAVEEMAERIAPHAVGISCGESPYFDSGDQVDPCQSCCELFIGLGMSTEVFKPGVLPRQTRETERETAVLEQSKSVPPRSDVKPGLMTRVKSLFGGEKS